MSSSNLSDSKKQPVEIIAVVEGGVLQDVYCTVPGRVMRIDIDHDADELCLVGQFDASAIGDFELDNDVFASFEKNVLERFGEAELSRIKALSHDRD